MTAIGESEGRPSSGRLADGSAVEYRGMLKMGKTERNGVDPQDLIDRYGADTARLFVMFAAPPEQSLDWNNAGVEGAHRFLKRLWKFAAKHADAIDSAPARVQPRGQAAALRHEIHSVLRQVSYDYERMQYNTVVSGAMKLLNALESHAGAGTATPATLREGLGIVLRVLYPVCPHTTWTLWNDLGFTAEHGRAARCAVAAGRRQRAGAGRDRADAADQRQAARQDPASAPAPTRRRSRRRRWPAPSSRSTAKAARRRR